MQNHKIQNTDIKKHLPIGQKVKGAFKIWHWSLQSWQNDKTTFKCAIQVSISFPFAAAELKLTIDAFFFLSRNKYVIKIFSLSSWAYVGIRQDVMKNETKEIKINIDEVQMDSVHVALLHLNVFHKVHRPKGKKTPVSGETDGWYSTEHRGLHGTWKKHKKLNELLFSFYIY